jgi:hypothetical protein
VYAGVKTRIGDEDYVVPPLSLGQLRNEGILALLQEHDKAAAETKTFEVMKIRGEIILAALRRNYPDFPEAKLYDFLDMRNTSDIWLAILGVSGFAPGEAQAAMTSGT